MGRKTGNGHSVREVTPDPQHRADPLGADLAAVWLLVFSLYERV